MPTTSSPAATKPLEQILRETGGENDSGLDSEDEQWTDALDSLPLTTIDSVTNPTEYPKGREPEEAFTEEEVLSLLKQGNVFKEQGNDRFRKLDWEGAIKAYEQALRTVPRRPVSSQEKDKSSASAGDPLEDDSEEQLIPQTSAALPLSQAEKDAASSRAVLNANLAACYVKLNKHAEAVKLCSEALHDDPQYVKAMHRRAISNETLNTWTSLSDAEKDYSQLQQLLPATDPLRTQVARALQTLPSRIETAKTKETEEMMAKLKDLGNTVLGKFGLSTDNFKFEPNGQGGYGMNFVR